MRIPSLLLASALLLVGCAAPTAPGLPLRPAQAVEARSAAPAAEATPPASLEEEARLLAETAEATGGFPVDGYTPYGVVVAAVTATTVTIAWRTDKPTRGVVAYARSGDWAKGETKSFRDDVAKTDHQITLTGLSRWRRHTYQVTALSALGLPFKERERSFRTRFWGLR